MSARWESERIGVSGGIGLSERRDAERGVVGQMGGVDVEGRKSYPESNERSERWDWDWVVLLG